MLHLPSQPVARPEPWTPIPETLLLWITPRLIHNPTCLCAKKGHPGTSAHLVCAYGALPTFFPIGLAGPSLRIRPSDLHNRAIPATGCYRILQKTQFTPTPSRAKPACRARAHQIRSDIPATSNQRRTPATSNQLPPSRPIPRQRMVISRGSSRYNGQQRHE